MPAKCKTCGHPRRGEIEQRLIAGESYADCEAWCKEQGINISKTSLQRHVEAGHIENYRRDGLPDYQQPGADGNDFFNEVITVPDIETDDELRRYVSHELRRATAHQVAILRAAQERYISGKGRYPKQELDGLKTVFMCLNMTRKHSAMFDTAKISGPGSAGASDT